VRFFDAVKLSSYVTNRKSFHFKDPPYFGNFGARWSHRLIREICNAGGDGLPERETVVTGPGAHHKNWRVHIITMVR
jgi:hypothetical protein